MHKTTEAASVTAQKCSPQGVLVLYTVRLAHAVCERTADAVYNAGRERFFSVISTGRCVLIPIRPSRVDYVA